MFHRNPWPGASMLASQVILALGLLQVLRAQPAGQVLSSGSAQTETEPGNNPTAAQSQPASNPPPAASPAQPATSQAPAKPGKGPGTVPDEPTQGPRHLQNDRIFFALPNYLTVEERGTLPALTTREKFKTVAEGCFDPVEVVFIGIQAGIGQADNTNPTYRQGLMGYSKRFGTAYADAIIGNFGTGAVFPAVLRQDPRYYQRGKGNFLYRAAYAAVRVFITRSDASEKTQFNFSEFLGNGLAAGIANAYHPGPHTLASNVDVLSTQVVMDAAGYELKEFWPDIHRLLLHLPHKANSLGASNPK